MDSFGTLLSPIDNLESFTHFHGAKSCSESHTQTIQQQAPSSKQYSDWHDLFDGPQFDNFVADFLGGAPIFQPQISQSTLPAWKPDIYRSLSESFTDSPASSYNSSSSCSPWTAVPGLTLASSPEFNGLDDPTTQYPSSLYFPSSEEFSSQAFKGLSLGSPIQLTCSSDGVDPNALVNAPIDLSDPAGFFNNALALDFAADNLAYPLGSSEHAVPISSSQNMLPPYGNLSATVSSENNHNGTSHVADGQLQASETVSGSTAEIDFAVIARTNCERPARTPSPTASLPSLSFLSVDPCASNNTSSELQVRASRRRTSLIDYSEPGYDGDSDDEQDGDYVAEDALTQHDQPTQQRTLKKKKSRTFSARESDDEEGGSGGAGSHTNETDGARRGGPSRGGRRVVSSASSSDGKQRRVKRRHSCIKPGCFSTFTRITDMERHVASVHRTADTDENRCRFCTKAFSREDAVLRHENDSCPARPKKGGTIKASYMPEIWA